MAHRGLYTKDGTYRVTAAPPGLSIAEGDSRGHAGVTRFGYNGAVAAATEEDIHDTGGTYTGWLTVADEVRIKVGGNAADTAAGLGAQSVMVWGLDENFAEASELIVTAGGSASAKTTTTFIRVNRAEVIDVGAYGVGNTGAIIIETEAGATVATIPATFGRSLMAMYTIPAGKTGYVVRAAASEGGGTTAAIIKLYKRPNADTVADPFTARQILHAFPSLSATAIDVPVVYEALPAKTDIWAAAIGGTGGSVVHVEFEIILVDN